MAVVYNAADRKQVVRAEKAAKLADLNRREVLVQLVSTPAGRQWLWERLARANIFETVYQDDPHRMYFLEGKRSEGLDLLGDWMQFAPDQFIEAMREANARRTSSTAADAATADRTDGEHPGGEEPGRESEEHASDGDLGEPEARDPEQRA